jgi:hypothetical protein
MPRWTNSASTSKRRSTKFSRKRRRVSSAGFAPKPAYARVFAPSALDRRSNVVIGGVEGKSVVRGVGGTPDEARAEAASPLVVVSARDRTVDDAPSRTPAVVATAATAAQRCQLWNRPR